MQVVAPGVHELRVRGPSTTVRVFYYVKLADAILVFHAFQKKTQKTPKHELITGQQRLKEVVHAKTGKRVTVRSAEELGRVLGLSVADTAEMEFRSDLTVALVTIIEAGLLTHAEIAKRAGTSRTRVTAIANGNTQGVSTDVLIRVLAATGHRAEVRVTKTAA